MKYRRNSALTKLMNGQMVKCNSIVMNKLGGGWNIAMQTY